MFENSVKLLQKNLKLNMPNQKVFFLTKTYVVGTLKNRLIETVLLSTQNICLNRKVREHPHFFAQKLCLSSHVSKLK